jgi:hypothetical protein
LGAGVGLPPADGLSVRSLAGFGRGAVFGRGPR